MRKNSITLVESRYLETIAFDRIEWLLTKSTRMKKIIKKLQHRKIIKFAQSCRALIAVCENEKIVLGFFEHPALLVDLEVI